MSHISELSCEDVLSLLDHGVAWHEGRTRAIGGSEAGIIASGDAERMERLRLFKCGAGEDVDLSLVLPVQMGSWSEPLNRLWLSRAIKMEVLPGTSIECASHPFMRANTDGVAADGGLVECKHTGAWSKVPDLLPRYYAQLQHCLHVAQAPFIYLSVFMGSDKHVWQKVERDEKYIDGLVVAEKAFWSYVESGVSLIEAQPVEAIIGAAPMRDVDMSESNSWATWANVWLEMKESAMHFEIAEKFIKELVPRDVKRASGHGIVVTRDGRGVTVKVLLP